MPYTDILYPNQPKVAGHQITYSFLTSVPSYYPKYHELSVPGPADIDNAYAIGNSVDNALFFIPLNPTPTVSLTPGQVGLVTSAIKSWNEVANVNLVPASSSGQVIGTPITGNGTLMTGPGTGGSLVPRADDDPSQLVDNSSGFDKVFANGLNFFGTTITRCTSISTAAFHLGVH